MKPSPRTLQRRANLLCWQLGHLRLESLEHRMLLSSAGDPDSAVGMGGLVTTHFSSGPALVAYALVEPDGKIVVAGSTASSATSGPSSFALARYNSDGSVDSSFGTDGQVITPNLGLVAAAGLQADGKILVLGENFVLARYNATDGSLDSTFGTGGTVTTQFVGLSNVQATSIAVPADGKIVVAGISTATPPFPTLRGGVLARYDPDGVLDATFGMGGELAASVGDCLLLQPDGKIVLGGESETWGMTFGISFSTQVQRLNNDGQPDVSFGSWNSRALIDFTTVTSLALQVDGRIVAAGPIGKSDGLVRLNPDGSPDATFGINGTVVLDSAIQGLAIQSDGKILVAGVPGGAFGVQRLNADGSPDTRFGVAGMAITASLSPPSMSRDVVLQPDGQIVVAGTSNGDFAVARFIGGPAAPLTGTPNQQFITQLYLDLLGRPVDPSGLMTWSSMLDQAMATRAQVVQLIDNSPEYRTGVIASLYGRLFGRAVDSSGLNTWSAFLAGGGTVEQLKANLLGSAEYWALSGGTNDGFLNALYRDVLYRTPDTGGVQTWGQVLSGGTPRIAVAAAILGSPESDNDEVQEMYHRYLHRTADASGLAASVSALQQGMPNEQLSAVLAASEEYFSRL